MPDHGTITLALAVLTPLLASAAIAEERLLTSFDGEDALSWMTVNDGVMGGVSQGGSSITEGGTLLFSGETSLRNNGGFSSIRTRPQPLKLSDYEGLRMRVKGDGRSYKLSLRTATAMGWVAYWAPFDTVADEWIEVCVPFADWVPTIMGREQRGPALDIDAINSIGFMMYDKQAGPFSLEVEFISAYRGSAGAQQEASIAELAAETGLFETLLAAAEVAGLEQPLAAAGPFTLFAPKDDSFANLPAGVLAELLEPANRIELIRVLQHHMVSGSLDRTELLRSETVTTLAGTQLAVTREGEHVLVDGVQIIAADVLAANGRIHVVADVLVPGE